MPLSAIALSCFSLLVEERFKAFRSPIRASPIFHAEKIVALFSTFTTFFS